MAFKNEYVAFYRFLIIIISCVSPLLLILAPLPSYLLFEGVSLKVKFLGFSFFVVLSFFEVFFYFCFWSRQELLYLIYIRGKRKVIVEHVKTFLITRVVFFIFVFSSFFKVSFSFFSIANVFLCYLLLLFVFFLFYFLKVKGWRPSRRIGCFRFWKVLNLFFSDGGGVRLVFLFLTLFLSVSFQKSSIEYNVLVCYLYLFFTVLLFVFYSLCRLVFLNVKRYEFFLRFIGVDFYCRCGFFLISFLFFLFLFSIFVNFYSLF